MTQEAEEPELKRHKPGDDSIVPEMVMETVFESRELPQLQENQMPTTFAFNHELAAQLPQATQQVVAEKKHQQRFSADEDKLIEMGIAKYGQDWQSIVNGTQLDRTAKQVKARYERLLLNSAKRQSGLQAANDSNDPIVVSGQNTPHSHSSRPHSPN